MLLFEDERLSDDKDFLHEEIERAFGQFERWEFSTEGADTEKRKVAWLAEQKSC